MVYGDRFTSHKLLEKLVAAVAGCNRHQLPENHAIAATTQSVDQGVRESERYVESNMGVTQHHENTRSKKSEE